jgi:hypothetical protein
LWDNALLLEGGGMAGTVRTFDKTGFVGKTDTFGRTTELSDILE